MFQELKLIFQANARIERYEVSNKFYSCKMEENSSISEHILRMSGYHRGSPGLRGPRTSGLCDVGRTDGP